MVDIDRFHCTIISGTRHPLSNRGSRHPRDKVPNDINWMGRVAWREVPLMALTVAPGSQSFNIKREAQHSGQIFPYKISYGQNDICWMTTVAVIGLCYLRYENIVHMNGIIDHGHFWMNKWPMAWASLGHFDMQFTNTQNSKGLFSHVEAQHGMTCIVFRDGGFNCKHHLRFEKWKVMQYIFHASWNKFSTARVTKTWTACWS